MSNKKNYKVKLTKDLDNIQVENDLVLENLRQEVELTIVELFSTIRSHKQLIDEVWFINEFMNSSLAIDLAKYSDYALSCGIEKIIYCLNIKNDYPKSSKALPSDFVIWLAKVYSGSIIDLGGRCNEVIKDFPIDKMRDMFTSGINIERCILNITNLLSTASHESSVSVEEGYVYCMKKISHSFSKLLNNKFSANQNILVVSRALDKSHIKLDDFVKLADALEEEEVKIEERESTLYG